VSTEPATEHVRTSVHGGVGRITLDRPRALNALTADMVAAVDQCLRRWRDDASVEAVLLDGEGERGLCAGGDVKMFHASALADGEEARDFWRSEYAMNAHVAEYPKPVVALMHGVVLGGGVGFGAHARHRLVTDGSSVGMPEVGIGFVPDVGGTWLLGRAPGELGLHLALTGLPVGPGDAVRTGLADAYAAPEELAAIRGATDADELVRRATSSTAELPAGELDRCRGWIDECFSAPTAADVVERLRATGDPEATAAADVIATRSPEAVELTLRAVRRARTLPSLREALEMELALSTASLLLRPDFVEGIRAQVVDKDRNPRWRPRSLAELDPERTARDFEEWLSTYREELVV
jgi:enoyl-CoA hydratase